MRKRQVNWEAFAAIGLNLVFMIIVFLFTWGIGHIPIYHRLLGLESLSIMGYFGCGLLYSFSMFLLVVILYCLAYGSCLLFGYLFPEKG